MRSGSATVPIYLKIFAVFEKGIHVVFISELLSMHPIPEVQLTTLARSVKQGWSSCLLFLASGMKWYQSRYTVYLRGGGGWLNIGPVVGFMCQCYVYACFHWICDNFMILLNSISLKKKTIFFLLYVLNW